MGGNKFKFMALAVLLSGSSPLQVALAVDGDVQYSAPYVIFDPETGKLQTVNPGPRLKAHPEEPAAKTPDPADTSEQPAAQPAADRTAAAAQAGEPNLSLPLIAALGCLLMAVGGFVIWKSKQSGTG